MKKQLRNSNRLIRAGLLFSGVLGLVNGAYGSEGSESVKQFELRIVESTTGADEIMDGNAAGAIKIIESSLSLGSKYEKSTNLCVAYTMQRSFSSAETYCRSAIYLSRSTHNVQNVSARYIPTRSREAMALNNLGVWHALQLNIGEAGEHFQAAGKKSKRLAITSENNVAALEQRAASQQLTAS